MKSNDTSPGICFPKSVRKNTAPLSTPTRCSGSPGKSLRISRAISVMRRCSRAREINIRTVSPPFPLGCGFFASFAFVAMICPFSWNRDSSLQRTVRQAVTSVLELLFQPRRITARQSEEMHTMNADQPAETTAATRSLPEPWLRGTLTDIPAVPRAVLHALELAGEDLQKWCSALTDAELNARPADLPPVAFHLRHIARSLDRLLTYAEGQALTQEQLTDLKNEVQPGVSRDALFAELTESLNRSAERIRSLAQLD